MSQFGKYTCQLSVQPCFRLLLLPTHLSQWLQYVVYRGCLVRRLCIADSSCLPGNIVGVKVVLSARNLVGSSVHVTLLQQLAPRHGREPARIGKQAQIV
jgi:hypothetical protein